MPPEGFANFPLPILRQWNLKTRKIPAAFQIGLCGRTDEAAYGIMGSGKKTRLKDGKHGRMDERDVFGKTGKRREGSLLFIYPLLRDVRAGGQDARRRLRTAARTFRREGQYQLFAGFGRSLCD